MPNIFNTFDHIFNSCFSFVDWRFSLEWKRPSSSFSKGTKSKAQVSFFLEFSLYFWDGPSLACCWSSMDSFSCLGMNLLFDYLLLNQSTTLAQMILFQWFFTCCNQLYSKITGSQCRSKSARNQQRMFALISKLLISLKGDLKTNFTFDFAIDC
jgi:hypothetical protein